MSSYPVLYEADYIEKRNRLTVFFRGLLIIPLVLVAYLVGLALFFTVIAAWFAVVITGRYPPGLYDFNANALRWLARVNAYGNLQVDKYPPFGFGAEPDYPARVTFAGPLPEYSRPKAFFRLLIAIPLLIIAYAMQLVYTVCAIAAWFVAVILGRLPKGIFDGLDLGLAYYTKSWAYLFLLTETYPPFTNEHATLEPVREPAALGTTPGAYAPPTSSLPAERPGGLEG